MAHQTYLQMIYEAISNSNKYEQSRIGISRQYISAYIKKNHSDSVSTGATFNTALRKAFKKGIQIGTIIHGDNKMRFKLKKGLIEELKKKKTKKAKNEKKTKKKKKKMKQKKKKQKEKTPPKPSQEDEVSEEDSEFKEDCCECCGSENDLIQCRYCADYICEHCLGEDDRTPYIACTGCTQSNNNWSGAWENYRRSDDDDSDDSDDD
eukprot:56492_1